jgi:predicted acyl esterase
MKRAVLAALLLASSLAAISNVAVKAASTEPTPYPGGTWAPGPEQYGVAADRLHMVPMDDGKNMRADVFFPTDPTTGEAAPGPFPVVITRTSYSTNLAITNNVNNAEEYWVKRGYIVVQADQRGTGLSDGAEWDVYGTRDGKDGAALAFWAAKLPHSNGNVGLFGCSSMGITQLATAIELGRTYGTNHPVKAMIPGCITGGLYRDTYFDNGIPGLTVPLATAEPAASLTHYAQYPLEGRQPRLQAEEIMTGGDMAYERDFWKQRKMQDGAADIVRSGIPALVYVAWGEGGHIAGLELYAQLQNAAAGRDPFGPMAKNQPVTGRYQLFIGEGAHGCCLNDRGVQLQWFDHWLKGADTGLSLNTKTPMHLQELGTHRYVNTSTYPFTRDYTKLPFGTGTDRLAWAPGQSASYESAPYPDGATLAGPISASVYATSSNQNLELGGALYDVAPDGTAKEISHGSVLGSLADYDSARSWKDSAGNVMRPYALFDWDRYKLPGSTNRYDLNIAPKLYAIAPGHKLRFTLVSQWGPDVCAGSGGIGPAPYGCVPTAPQVRSLTGGQYTIDRTRSFVNLPLLPAGYFPTAASGPTPTSGGTVVPTDWG